jgi:DnaJ-domain-containing protein 1
MWAVLAASAVGAILLSGGIFFLWASLASLFLIWLGYGQAKIDATNFMVNPGFDDAAAQLAALRRVPHFNHDEETVISHTRSYRGITADKPFLVFASSTRILILTPLRYWIGIGRNVSSGETRAASASGFQYTVTVASPNKADIVYGETWEHATKAGDPDFRFKRNRKLFQILKFGVQLHLRDQMKLELGGLNEAGRTGALNALRTVFGVTSGRHEERSQSSSGEDRQRQEGQGSEQQRKSNSSQNGNTKRPWYEVLNVPRSATEAEVKAAWRKLAKEYHPDRIKGVEGLGAEFEQFATRKLSEINVAYDEALATFARQ